MAIQIISKLIQRNGRTYKLMDAKDVSYDGTEEVSIKDKVDQIVENISLKKNISMSESQPDSQKEGDFWLEEIVNP